MFNANVKTVQHRDQRYDTLGDWYMEGGCLQVKVSSMGNADYEFLIAMHEMIERQLCRKMGITEQTVDAWDLAHEDVEEPGAMDKCPYREAHLVAEGIERAVAVKLGVDWEHYDKTCRAILAAQLPPADPTNPMNEKYRPSNRIPKVRGKVRERSVLKGR